MSGVTGIALVILCFAGGYILVTSLFNAFGKKPPQAPGTEADRHRAVLLIRAGASREELYNAYRTQRDRYASVAEEDPSEEMRALARKKTLEVEQAYAYFMRNPRGH